MKDSVILGSGNSRYLKSVQDFKSLYPTYDDFAEALVAGTLPVDFNGINPSGFQQVGDGLGKNTILKDATAALLGGDASMLPDEALAALIQKVNENYSGLSGLIDNLNAAKAEVQKITYTGTGGNSKSFTFSKTPKVLIIATTSGSNGFAIGFAVYNSNAWTTSDETGDSQSYLKTVGTVWGENSLTIRGANSIYLNRSGSDYVAYVLY